MIYKALHRKAKDQAARIPLSIGGEVPLKGKQYLLHM